MAETDLAGRPLRDRILRLERVLRQFVIFFGMDERDENRSMFREARRLLDWDRGSDTSGRPTTWRTSDEEPLAEDGDPKWQTVRDVERERELLARRCGLCGSSLVLADTFADTGRPSRLRCSRCDTLYRVDYESTPWHLQIVEE